MLPHPPYQRITWRGKRFNRRTVDMIKWAEEKAGFKFVIGQGSYNTGVSASAGTHDGGGAADFSVRDLTITQRIKMVRALKDAGFAAWYRPAIPNIWPPHVHAVAIKDKELAWLARAQVADYFAGRNGLKGHAKDKTYRPDPFVMWDYAKAKPVRYR
jgi:hypothetical protein